MAMTVYTRGSGRFRSLETADESKSMCLVRSRRSSFHQKYYTQTRVSADENPRSAVRKLI